MIILFMINFKETFYAYYSEKKGFKTEQLVHHLYQNLYV